MFKWLHRECVESIDYERREHDKVLQILKDIRKERDNLKDQLPTLLGKIQEQKGILEYTLHDKEQEIQQLKSVIDQVMKDGATHIQERDDEIASLKKTIEERVRHTELILADAAIAIQNKGILMEKCSGDCKKDPEDFFKGQQETKQVQSAVKDIPTASKELIDAWNNCELSRLEIVEKDKPKSRFEGKGVKPSEFLQRYNNLPTVAVPLQEKNTGPKKGKKR